MRSAVIFAGGKSSRMGRDKALLPFGGYDSMVEFQYRKLQNHFDQVYISSKESKFKFSAIVVKDLYPQSSPIVAFASIFKQLDEDELFILGVDMPFVGSLEIESLIELYNGMDSKPDVLISKSPRGLEPLCGIYSRSILTVSQQFISKDIHKLKLLLGKVDTKILQFKDQKSFANINTPKEYTAALH